MRRLDSRRTWYIGTSRRGGKRKEKKSQPKKVGKSVNKDEVKRKPKLYSGRFMEGREKGKKSCGAWVGTVYGLILGSFFEFLFLLLLLFELNYHYFSAYFLFFIFFFLNQSIRSGQSVEITAIDLRSYCPWVGVWIQDRSRHGRGCLRHAQKLWSGNFFLKKK